MLTGCQDSKGIAGLQKMPRTEPSPPGIEWLLATTRQITFMLQTFNQLLTFKSVFWTRHHASPRNRNVNNKYVAPPSKSWQSSQGKLRALWTHLNTPFTQYRCDSGKLFLLHVSGIGILFLLTYLNKSKLPSYNESKTALNVLAE